MIDPGAMPGTPGSGGTGGSGVSGGTEFFGWGVLILVSASKANFKRSTIIWASEAEAKFGTMPDACRTLQPVMAELVAHRLMKVLGVGTAPAIEVLDVEQALRRDPGQFIFKPIRASGLKMCPREELSKAGHWTLAVRKIPQAIPLSFLRKQYGVDAAPVEFAEVGDLRPVPTDLLTITISFLSGNVPKKILFDTYLHEMAGVLWEGKAEFPNAAEFFADFLAPGDWSAVRRAIAWNSEQMLALHAGRLFLGATAAHASNILVDPDGRLHSIDHEYCSRTDSEELRTVFDNIKPGTVAFNALRGVAELTEEKVRRLFEDLPIPPGVRWFQWPLGSKEKTAAYYLARLDLWKQRFEEMA